MEIGEKIKSIRLSKRMTQSELAGDQITRNMLSLIENGSALPSLPTIMYLSERLGVPAGMFLAREDEESVYVKMSRLPQIKQAYEKGEYRLCCDMCKSLIDLNETATDDELLLILAECHYGIAIEEFNSGRLHNSCREFDVACGYADKTIYRGDYIKYSAAVHFEYMKRLSPLLFSEGENEIYSGSCFCADAFCKYASVLNSLENGDVAVVECYVNTATDSEKSFSEHIKAELEMKNGDFSSARNRLNHLINGDEMICRTVMYDAFKALEECCREIGDYKGAYESSVSKVELLEHMLTY